MKFSAVLALAAGVSAGSNAVSYVTETVTAVTTFCPEPTEITYGDITYTVTEPTTLTITDCNPCTIHRPVTTISSVVCSTSCPSPSPKPPQVNSTIPVVPPTKTPIGTISPPSPTDARPPIETAGAGRTAALSGGALAGLLGLAAFVL